MSTKNIKAKKTETQMKAEFMTALANIMKEIADIKDVKIPRAWKHKIGSQAITVFMGPDDE